MRTFTLVLALMLSGMLLQAQTGSPCPGEPTVTYDGKTYNTILVGDRCWLKENLNVGTMILSNQKQTNNSVIEKYCYGDLPANCETYGGIYQWKEAMQYDAAPGAQGICPPGWRIPSDNEWKMLEGAADSQFNYGDPEWDNMNFRGFDAGFNLKAMHGWMYNGNGADLAGAAVLPGGHRDFCGTYYSEGHSNYLWTSTEQSDKTAWYRMLSSNSMQVSRRYAHKNMGASVRCIRDYTPPATYNLNLEVYPADAGTVTGAGQYEAGEEVNITAEANTGWEFVNWTDTDGIVSEVAVFTYTMPAEDVTLTANFVEEQVGFTCGTSTVTDIDGYVYNTLLIGNQCWMAENLSAAHYRDGSAITDAWVYDHNLVPGINSDEEMVAAYGRLYSWHAANDAKGICPEGWIVPAIAQWDEMENYLIDNYEEVWGPPGLTGSNAGAALMSCRQVNSPQGGDCATNVHPRWIDFNVNGFDIVGFSGLPAGQVVSGVSSRIGELNYYWTSSEFNAANGWFTRLGWAHLVKTNVAKIRGYSVRCIKDVEPPPPTYNLNLEVYPADAGTVTGAGQYEAGAEVNITAEANTGWEFVNWTDTDGIVSEVPDFVYTMPAGDITFTANFVEEFNCGTSTVTDIDGNVYNTLLIGNQCWMGKNLQTAHYRDGSAIDAWVYDHNLVPGINSVEEMVAAYGRLYSWHAANDAKGICPEGWIVPAIAQWDEMENYLINNYQEVWGPPGLTGSNAGAALMSCRQENSPQGGDCATSDHPRWNEPAGNLTSGFDIVGFSGLPAGQVVNGVSQWNGLFNYYWSSSEFSATNGWFTRLGWAHLVKTNVAKIRGYSVRCIKE